MHCTRMRLSKSALHALVELSQKKATQDVKILRQKSQDWIFDNFH